jgi:cell division septal protein FtsQ
MSDEKPRYSQNRRLKQAKLQRQVRQSQRRLKRLRVFYRWFLLFGILGLIFFILKLPQWRLPVDAFDSLNSSSLEIVNNRIVPSQKILSALRRNQVPTQPIFLVKTDDLKKSITQLEPVQNVYIRRFGFPARLQIIVIERTPIVSITPNLESSPIAFFSADGKLIGREYMPLNDDYDTVSVITYGKDDDYRNWDVTKVVNFKRLATLVETETGEKVEYIDMRNPNDVYVKIKTTSIRLGTLDNTVYERIKRIYTILPQISEVNNKIKYIDLSWDRVNYLKLQKSK